MQQQEEERKFNIYRCPDPLKYEVNSPWYRYTDICPCNPTYSNLTGRGYVSCPWGIEDDSFNMEETPWETNLNFTIPRNYGNEGPRLKGALYQNNNIVPPQLQPRPLARIGVNWRSGY